MMIRQIPGSLADPWWSQDHSIAKTPIGICARLCSE